MRDRESTHPFVFFFLVLPYGISSGFVSITLPFILTRVGFSVALAASIVAIGVSANLWRFLWGPVADLTLTARRWYLLGLGTSAATLVILALLPLHQNAVPVLMTVVFISQVAGTLIVLPVGGLMAHTVAENAKGRAAGWYQAGNLGGNGIGGGVGVWLASHFSKEIAGGALAIAMLASAAAIYFACDVRIVSTETLGERMRILWRDILSMVRSAIPLFTIVLVCSPIGAGAMNNLWSAVAPDWKAPPDQVALVSGVLNGVLSAIGCVIGGWVADRVGRWWAYFGSGILIAMVCDGRDYHGGGAAHAQCVHRRRSCLRPDLWNGLCRLFRDRPARHWPRRRFHQIRNALVPGQPSHCLHDRVRRMGARSFRHGLDAAFRSADCNYLHRPRTRSSSLDQSAEAL